MDPRIIKNLDMKLKEMYNAIHIPEPMGTAAATALHKTVTKSKKPMPAFALNAVGFFKDKMDDRHTPILLSVFCMIFTQVLFDPKVGCITMTEAKKGGNKDGNGKHTTGKEGT